MDKTHTTNSALMISKRTNLDFYICRGLVENGWTFIYEDGGPSVWVSPSASLPKHIPHSEPKCDMTCGNRYPHQHGLSCHSRCVYCHGVCHFGCPAYKKG
jgi:hypothetical protein